MPRSKPRGPLLPGAHKLRAFLDAEGISLPTFCEEKGLDRFKVQRLLNGTTRRVDVELAGQIRDATMREGRPVIDFDDWRTPPAPPSQRRQRKEKGRKTTKATTKPAARAAAA